MSRNPDATQAMAQRAAESKNRRLQRETMRSQRKAKPLLERWFRKIGLAVHKYQKDYHYCPQIYGYGYWKKINIPDLPGFGELATTVIGQGRTFLSYDRLYVLYQALWNARRLSADPMSMAEAGVYRGGSTYFIASAAERLFESQPTIHAFDTFEGFPDDLDPDFDVGHWPGKFGNNSFSEVSEYLSVFSNVKLHKGRVQDCSKEVTRERFSFVHIDVDIYTATVACLDFFADLVVPGAMIVVDDYGFIRGKGAKEAVDGFIAERKDFLMLHLDTGQCALIRVG